MTGRDLDATSASRLRETERTVVGLPGLAASTLCASASTGVEIARLRSLRRPMQQRVNAASCERPHTTQTSSAARAAGRRRAA
jgi:hypothetical protein